MDYLKSINKKQKTQKYNNNKTYLLPCVGLADIIENGDDKEIKKYLNDNIKKYKGIVKNVVLGCTHYPLIQKQIKEVLGDVNFFNGAEKVAEHLKKTMEKNGNDLNKTQTIKFIDSQGLESKKQRFYEIIEEKNC